MLTRIQELQELLTYWKTQEYSEQRTVVIGVHLASLSKLCQEGRYNSHGDLVPSSYTTKTQALKAVANFHGVPFKKKGEWLQQQRCRILNIS